MGTHGGEGMVLEAIVVGSRIMEVVMEVVVMEVVVMEVVVMEVVVIINTESTIFRDASSLQASYSQLGD
jgi:hypothetical protein